MPHLIQVRPHLYYQTKLTNCPSFDSSSYHSCDII